MSDANTQLAQFIDAFDRDKIVADAAQIGKFDPQMLRKLLDTYLSEAKVGWELIAADLSKHSRILEVGSGIGVLTAFLKSQGYEILGLEPGEKGGFSFMTALSQALMKQLEPGLVPQILDMGAEELSLEAHGSFDLIFSVHVMEHIMPLAQATKAMANVLKPDGKMRHLCPNYSFPYEPHLGIALVPFYPKATRRIRPGPINRQLGIWQAVNFITAFQISKLAKQSGLSCQFEPAIMAQFFARLQADPEFASRHGGFIGMIGRIPILSKVMLFLLGSIPAKLATPMVMTLSHKTNSS